MPGNLFLAKRLQSNGSHCMQAKLSQCGHNDRRQNLDKGLDDVRIAGVYQLTFFSPTRYRLKSCKEIDEPCLAFEIQCAFEVS